jgi:hypothetical protein
MKDADLILFCNKQIMETPKWLTPYLFLGIAQWNIGLKEKAIINLKKIVENYPNTTLDPENPAYQKAIQILKEVEQLQYIK